MLYKYYKYYIISENSILTIIVKMSFDMSVKDAYLVPT